MPSMRWRCRPADFSNGRSLLSRPVFASALFCTRLSSRQRCRTQILSPPLWFVFRGSLRSGVSSFLRVLSERTVLTAFVALSHGKRCGALRAPIRTSISLLDSTHLTKSDERQFRAGSVWVPHLPLVWTTLLQHLAKGAALGKGPSSAALFKPSSCSPLQQVPRRSSVQGVKYLYIFHCRVPFPTVVQTQMGMQNAGIGRGWSPLRY